jgi:poly(3-hydroxybutyrate) depolymerase
MKMTLFHFVPSFVMPCFFVPCLFMMATVLANQETETPAPGKQVVQSVEIPASTSVWNFGDGIRNIGEPRPLDESKRDTVRYWLFLPTDYESQAQSGGAPLLLFLHGAGERGSEPEDIAKVKVHGPPRLLDTPEFAKRFPCITVSPQCKNGYAWSPAQLMLLLDHIEKHYKVDTNRIYITGLSMGGFGTWMCLNEAPKRFAAAAPICGGAKTEWAEKVTEIPIWVFHGDQDAVVVPALSEQMVEAVRKAGGKKIFLTMYEGEGHDSWTRTYNNQMLYDWMFQQSQETDDGNSKPQTNRIKGTVLHKGTPVSDVMVTFHPVVRNNGTAMHGNTDSNGEFILQPASIIPGEYMVTFSKENQESLPQMYTRAETTPFVAFVTTGLNQFTFSVD